LIHVKADPCGALYKSSQQPEKTSGADTGLCSLGDDWISGPGCRRRYPLSRSTLVRMRDGRHRLL